MWETLNVVANFTNCFECRFGLESFAMQVLDNLSLLNIYGRDDDLASFVAEVNDILCLLHLDTSMALVPPAIPERPDHLSAASVGLVDKIRYGSIRWPASGTPMGSAAKQ